MNTSRPERQNDDVQAIKRALVLPNNQTTPKLLGLRRQHSFPTQRKSSRELSQVVFSTDPSGKLSLPKSDSLKEKLSITATKRRITKASYYY